MSRYWLPYQGVRPGGCFGRPRQIPDVPRVKSPSGEGLGASPIRVDLGEGLWDASGWSGCLGPSPPRTALELADFAIERRFTKPGEQLSGLSRPFRGVLDMRPRTHNTDEMVVAAAREPACFTEEHGMSAEKLLPRTDEWELYP